MLVTMSSGLGVLGLFGDTSLPTSTSVEIERTAMGFTPEVVTLLITGDHPGEVESALQDGPAVRDVRTVEANGTEHVCRVTWEHLPAFVNCARTVDGSVRAAHAVGSGWTFDLRFPDRAAASRCLSVYDGDESLTIERIRSADDRQGSHSPTAKQREVLGRALAMGYFDVPRRTSLIDLAEELGVSDTAVSERLRRGTRAVLRNAGYDRYGPESSSQD